MTNKAQLLEDFNYVIDYLNEKNVPFAVKNHHNDDNDDNELGSVSLFGVKITKEGKFFRANGKIIAGNHVNIISKFI